MTRHRILLISSRPEQVALLDERIALSHPQVDLISAYSLPAGRALLEQYDVDGVLIGLDGEDEEPLRLCRDLTQGEISRPIPVVLVADAPRPQCLFRREYDAGALGVLEPPYPQAQVAWQLRAMLQVARLEAQLRSGRGGEVEEASDGPRPFSPGQKRQAESQKLEAVGRLAAGIAHEFNNLHTAIRGNLQMLARILPEAGPAHRTVLHTLRASSKAVDLTRQLLEFARPGQAVAVPIDLSRLLHRVESLMRPNLPARMQCVVDCPPRPVLVEADPAQLAHAVLELCFNAREAMGQAGTIRIALALDARGPDGQAGSWARIEVADQGEGMDEETAGRALEPFFSTREIGQGRGLGLASVYGIVQAHGGDVQILSRHGQGTTIQLFLPVRENPPQPGASPVKLTAAASRSARALLLEPQGPTRQVTRRALEDLGYHVQCPRSATELVERLSAPADGLRAVIADLDALDDPGRIEHLLRQGAEPRPRLILTTDRPQRQLPTAPDSWLLGRPYRMEDLLDLLSRTSPTPSHSA
jgi:signal transduction histidine kinase